MIVTVVLNRDNFKENILHAQMFFKYNEGRSASTYLYDRMLCIFVEPCPDITWKGGMSQTPLFIWQTDLYLG